MAKKKLTMFGIAVQKRLVETGMDQKELAAKVGTSEVYLHRILYGERAGHKYVDEIAEVLKLKTSDIHNYNQYIGGMSNARAGTSSRGRKAIG